MYERASALNRTTMIAVDILHFNEEKKRPESNVQSLNRGYNDDIIISVEPADYPAGFGISAEHCFEECKINNNNNNYSSHYSY